MPGFSITMLLLPAANDTGTPSADLILSLLDDSTNTPGWKWSSRSVPKPASVSSSLPTATHAKAWSASLKAPDINQFNSAVERACRALITAEPEITRMDNIAGDGDCGLTLKGGATGASHYDHDMNVCSSYAYSCARGSERKQHLRQRRTWQRHHNLSYR